MKCVGVVPDEQGLVAEFKCDDCTRDDIDEEQEQNECCVQGDTARCPKPPVDLKTKVPLWPGQNGTLIFKSTGGLDNMMCHPVVGVSTALSWAMREKLILIIFPSPQSMCFRLNL